MNTAAKRTKANLKIVREQNGVEYFSTRGADKMLTLSLRMKYSCVDFLKGTILWRYVTIHLFTYSQHLLYGCMSMNLPGWAVFLAPDGLHKKCRHKFLSLFCYLITRLVLRKHVEHINNKGRTKRVKRLHGSYFMKGSWCDTDRGRRRNWCLNMLHMKTRHGEGYGATEGGQRGAMASGPEMWVHGWVKGERKGGEGFI